MINGGVEPGIKTYNYLLKQIDVKADANRVVREMRRKGVKADKTSYSIMMKFVVNDQSVERYIEVLWEEKVLTDESEYEEFFKEMTDKSLMRKLIAGLNSKKRNWEKESKSAEEERLKAAAQSGRKRIVKHNYTQIKPIKDR